MITVYDSKQHSFVELDVIESNNASPICRIEHTSENIGKLYPNSEFDIRRYNFGDGWYVMLEDMTDETFCLSFIANGDGAVKTITKEYMAKFNKLSELYDALEVLKREVDREFNSIKIE